MADEQQTFNVGDYVQRPNDTTQWGRVIARTGTGTVVVRWYRSDSYRMRNPPGWLWKWWASPHPIRDNAYKPEFQHYIEHREPF